MAARCTNPLSFPHKNPLSLARAQTRGGQSERARHQNSAAILQGIVDRNAALEKVFAPIVENQDTLSTHAENSNLPSKGVSTAVNPTNLHSTHSAPLRHMSSPQFHPRQSRHPLLSLQIHHLSIRENKTLSSPGDRSSEAHCCQSFCFVA
jgi:hypothetical protein